MGGFFNLVDLKQGKMARKFGTQKRNVGGLEAPRNSLDLPVGTYKSYYTPQDDTQQKYQETYEWSETGYFPPEAPMKKLISDEMSKRPNTKANSPSIVARLMGVDTLPQDPKPNPVNDPFKERLTRSSSASSALSSKSFRQISFDSFHLHEDSDTDDMSSMKPMPREHPQEEELQKFKKEFEAYQSARFKECSKIIEHDTISDQWIAQENLNKVKLNLYANPQSNLEKESYSRSKLEKDSHPPKKIVILRPGFENYHNPEESFASSSTEERNNIEDFLEEVKERLKCELQGQSWKKGVVRGSGIETPYSERPSDPKQIAQRIAKQVRDSVSKDLGTNLLRSVSTRSYKGEFQCSGTNSPEFISKDTRRLLSERLRNVLNERIELKDENEIQSKSFRCGYDEMILKKDSSSSPINLVRSLSAPVSGTSFGKLLLEDRHVITGAHIRRKHEANEKLKKLKKSKKEKFNLKEKVSSFRYSLSLRARLFGRKIHSASEFRDNDRNFVKDMMNGPTVMMNFPERPENSTEVPPSPASVCSSIHDEFYRYCASPTTTTTTPGAPTSDDNDMPQAFRDISSNLSELRKQLHELEHGHVIEDEPYEPEITEVEDEDEAYIQDLLIASGLHKSLSKCNTFAKPISNKVFEQVESLQKHKINTNDHKLLLDLLNEVLSTVLDTSRRKSTNRVVKPPHGGTLLDQVWGMLRAYLHPHVDKSFYFFDTMVGRDLQSVPWLDRLNEETDALAKEVECQIIIDLVEEMVRDMRDDFYTCFRR